jgi:hypothetical protein
MRSNRARLPRRGSRARQPILCLARVAAPALDEADCAPGLLQRRERQGRAAVTANGGPIAVTSKVVTAIGGSAPTCRWCVRSGQILLFQDCSNTCSTRFVVSIPWPAECRPHHPWRPETATVTWEPCDCPAARAARGGHITVRCGTELPGRVEDAAAPDRDPAYQVQGHAQLPLASGDATGDSFGLP